MPQFNSGAAEPIGRFSEGLSLRLLHACHFSFRQSVERFVHVHQNTVCGKRDRAISR